MKKQSPQKGEHRRNKILLIQSIAMVVIAAVLLGGVTRAWFVSRADITTLVEVSGPTDISILGPHGSAMTQLDLSYTDSDKSTDSEGNTTVTIDRVISISSDEPQHELEIVHTTNMNGLTFKVYEATEVSESNDTDSITSGGYKYSYDKNKPLDGVYLNEDVSRKNGGYKYADNTYHNKNYSYSNVQTHVEPLYYLVKKGTSSRLEATQKTADNTNVSTAYLTHYILEISWQETEKETDIFYVLAKK